MRRRSHLHDPGRSRAEHGPVLPWLALLLSLTAPLAATPPVPEPLEPWVPWVLAKHPRLVCPLLDGERLCAWPGRLALDLDDRGGRFTLEVEADRELDLPLPGDPVHWPEEVRLGGETALMLGGSERPTVRLSTGRHRLTGRFRWSRLPESLAVPPSIALVDLRLRGQDMQSPHREAGGLLWLAASRDREVEQERLTLTVHRRIDDGVPVKLTTRLRLRVSGQAREIDLGVPLPASFELAWLGGQLPMRWAEGERLVVQARPGSWEITLEARSTGPVGELVLGERPEPWPAREVWVFAADSAVRAVRVGGAPGIDPQRTALPEEWKSLPAFQLTQGAALGFTELRRGEAEPTPDSVRISRTWWLAQEGDRFTVRDDLEGEIHQGGRLEVLAPAELGRAAFGHEVPAGGSTAGDQVVTLGPESRRAGVEVRAGALDLDADLTYPRGGALPAAGWSTDARELKVQLFLPPGWTLLAATGVDHAGGSWVERWTLLDFFLLLILALATWKLDGWRWGVLALGLLGLAWHEPWARGLWCWWLLLLPLRALLAVLDEGIGARLVRGLRWLVVVGLAVQVVVFCFVQWRTGRSPQLEMTSGGQRYAGLASAGKAAYRVDEMRMEQETEPMAPSPREQKMSKPKRGRYAAQQTRSAQIDPNAVVQTGPGVPSWSWNPCTLAWTGPVSADHELRLFLVPPAVELVLSLLRIVGAILIGLFLIDPRRTQGALGPPSVEGAESSVLTATVGLACLGLLPMLPAVPVVAQESPAPPATTVGTPVATDLLGELENRLTVVPACHPTCVEVPRLRLEAASAGLTLDADVHVAALSAWRLPGPAAAWAPGRIRVDGRPTSAVRLGDDGFLLLRLAPGVHRVELSGPATDSLALQFPLRPRRLSVVGDGWTIDGYRPDEPPPGSLRLDRQLPLETLPGETGAVELEPWLELRRELDIGLPWLVHHELRRVGPSNTAVLVRVPLLAGESVTTAGIPVEAGAAAAGEAIVRLEPGETSRNWQSTLEETETLTLEAPADRPWLERWELACSPLWNCRAEGLVPSRHMQTDTWRPLWQPWPGEEVTLHFVRPTAAPGQTLTIDAAELRVKPGRRLLEGTLTLSLRASRGGEQTLGLPVEAALQSFQVDGQAQPTQMEEGQLVFTLEPGHHKVEAAWRQDHDTALFERIPQVRLAGEAVNVGVTIEVPSNRWLLWAGGPGWGPVVKFWEYLAVLALVALALGRFTKTPLSAVDWLLLGAGMTQVPLAAAVAVVLWLLVLSGRHHWRPRRWWSYDFGQLVIFGWGLIALGILYASVHTGLLVQPDMQVLGPGSHGSMLHWYVERIEGALPQPWLLWLPLWVWRLLMLLWSLWLAARLLRWLPWCWQRFTLGPALASPKGFRRWMEAGKERQPEPASDPGVIGHS